MKIEKQTYSRINSRITGTGPSLVLLPGLGLNLHIFDDLVAILEKQYQCVCLDFSGNVPISESNTCSIRSVALEIHTWLQQNKIVPESVIGHSLGGFIAMELALAVPDIVPTLVLISSTARGDDSLLELFIPPKPLPARKMLTRNMELSVYKPFRRTPAFKQAVANQAKYPGNGKCFMPLLRAATTFNIGNALRDIECPTLILCGRQDAVVSPALANSLLGGIPRNMMICLEKVGHLPQLEAPEQTAVGIQSFLRRSRKKLTTMPIIPATWQS
jgi:pimeloyl-ACP methyl ester carboxylesterase